MKNHLTKLFAIPLALALLLGVTAPVFAAADPEAGPAQAEEAAPQEEDFVRYFLSESKEGFCVHFASAAVLLLRLSQNSRVNGDAAIALISSSALAVGVVTVSVTTGMNTEVSSYMFGSVLALSRADAALSVALSLAVLALFLLFYPRIFAVTFDETFSRATGVRAGAYNSLLAVLTAVTVVLGMRMMGALLISSLIIFPALSAMRLCRSFKGVVLFAAAVSVCCFTAGLIASYFLETPTGASIVLADLLVFALCSLARRK